MRRLSVESGVAAYVPGAGVPGVRTAKMEHSGKTRGRQRLKDVLNGQPSPSAHARHGCPTNFAEPANTCGAHVDPFGAQQLALQLDVPAVTAELAA